MAHPAGHRQSAEPAAANLPAGQGVGVVAPAGQKEPAVQGRHALEDVPPVLGL